MKARLALQDGAIFYGESFGSQREGQGEAVFNTSMTGYQEILTDPSYCEQVVTMTYPLIGNYGVNPEDAESEKIHVSGLVVREYLPFPSNFRSRMPLDEYLRKEDVPGIQGVDTRAVTRRLRVVGAMPCIVTTSDESDQSLRERAAGVAGMKDRNLAPLVTRKEKEEWSEGFDGSAFWPAKRPYPDRFNVVVIDCGVKRNILRWLVACGCKVTIVPAPTPAEEIMGMAPDGALLSNGPGDPAAVTDVIQTVRSLAGKVPLFGICLGHQILSLAMGARTFKLKFGHRGANQPVRDVRTRKVKITSQNHGFAVDFDSLEGTGLVTTEINLNDNTSEGVEHTELPAFAVQYHPEASPGPREAAEHFDKFVAMMKAERK